MNLVKILGAIPKAVGRAFRGLYSVSFREEKAYSNLTPEQEAEYIAACTDVARAGMGY